MSVTTGLAMAEPFKEDIILYKHPDRYSAFPSLTKGPADQLWVGFGWNTTGSHYGKAPVAKRAAYPSTRRTVVRLGINPAKTSNTRAVPRG